MKEQPGRPEQPTGMKEQPIVVLDRIRPEVVVKWIRTAVLAKLIQRETRANDGAGKTGLHLIGDRPRIGKKSKLSCRANADEWGFLDEAEAEDGLAKRGKAEGLMA